MRILGRFIQIIFLNHSNGGKRMSQLTSKELTLIGEQLSAEQLLITKFNQYAKEADDPQIKSKFEQIAAKHQGHYNKLLSYLS